jgi:cytochrome c biogenesis protein CcmG, thiol:disulfide interchange protein DsbE
VAAPQVGTSPSRRPILVALFLAAATTLAVVAIVTIARPGQPSSLIDRPAPDFTGTTLDGAPFRLADLRGKPVFVNFWGPTCVPCRTEFPLIKSKLAEHAADGLVVVGVLTYDPPDLARTFIAEEGATWVTVDDPGATIRQAYRVAARPQSYFIDREGILRSIQIGEVRDADFERQYDLISGGA